MGSVIAVRTQDAERAGEAVAGAGGWGGLVRAVPRLINSLDVDSLQLLDLRRRSKGCSGTVLTQQHLQAPIAQRLEGRRGRMGVAEPAGHGPVSRDGP